MEYLIISDTHGNYHTAAEVIAQAGHVDMIVHLGDETGDAVVLEHIFNRPVEKVAGNCDAPGKHPRELCVDLCGTTMLLTHGDRYQVKMGLAQLQKRAESAHARVVLYGHTHRAAIDEINGVLFINPGSLHRMNAELSYARLSLINGNLTASIIPVAVNDSDQHAQNTLTVNLHLNNHTRSCGTHDGYGLQAGSSRGQRHLDSLPS
ncbi:MAG: YfcE family phosphodiesterase [Geobacter sp.]|nr:YfcE family phosphodiesterase [Geobacter sp.]